MKYDIDYKNIYDNSPDMCLSTEVGTGQIVECNETLLSALGFEKHEVLSRSVVEMYHPDDLTKVTENLQSFSKTGTITHSEFRVLKKNGDFIEVSLKFNPVKDAKGKILYSNAVWRDITEIKKIQRELRSEKEKSENLLLNILPKSIVERLKESPDIIVDGLANSTTLFCDIVGFTAISQQVKPEKLISMLNLVFSEFDRLVEVHGLEKIKTIGDAYMVACGLPMPRDDHATAMAEFALQMMAAMERINSKLRDEDLGEPLEIRVGMNSGPVVAGVIGTKKFSYDMWGDSVNIASRMESHGLTGEIQLSAATYELIKNRYNCEDRGEIEIKGKGPMQTYLLKSKKIA